MVTMEKQKWQVSDGQDDMDRDQTVLGMSISSNFKIYCTNLVAQKNYSSDTGTVAISYCDHRFVSCLLTFHF